jgi:outer membrane protein assembly factor BamB
VGDKIFFGSCSGNFLALDKSSARVLWKYDITRDGNQRSFHVTPAADQDVIYVGCDYGKYFTKQERVGHLYAFDQKTGALKWKHKVEIGVGSDPVFDDADVFIVTVEDELLSLRKDSGRLNWAFKREGQVRQLFPKASPLLDAQRLYLGAGDGHFYALDKRTGKTIWEKDLGKGIYTSPAIANDFIYVVTLGRMLYRLDKKRGDISGLFTLPTGPSLAPLIDGSSVFIQSQRNLYALDLELKHVKWKIDLGSYFAGRFPLLLKEFIVVATQDGRIRCFRREHGSPVWEYKVKGEITAGIAESQNVIYVGTREGMVYAIRIK